MKFKPRIDPVSRIGFALRICRELFRSGLWVLRGQPIPPPQLVKWWVIVRTRRRHAARVLLETGTYRGDTVAVMRVFFDRLISIELDEGLYRRARERLGGFPHVELLHGDSARILPQALASLHEPAVLWLDAHYSGKGTAHGALSTPIAGEIKAALGQPERHAILIDDARCFDGRGGYPDLVDLHRLASEHSPAYRMFVQDDIIHLLPASEAAARRQTR